MFDITIDSSDFENVLVRINQKVDGIETKALMKMGDELLRLSNKEVPHDEGVLASTGVVEPEGKDVVVGYHTPYAARLHEHPEYSFQKGRKGKYLEDPLKHNLSKWLMLYAKELERAFR